MSPSCRRLKLSRSTIVAPAGTAPGPPSGGTGVLVVERPEVGAQCGLGVQAGGVGAQDERHEPPPQRRLRPVSTVPAVAVMPVMPAVPSMPLPFDAEVGHTVG